MMDMRTDLRRSPAVAEGPAVEAVAVEGRESPLSSISWSAVIAGAVVSAALALVLLVLCIGLKLTAVSPWVASTSTAMLGVTTIVGAVLVQLIASAVGGYVAGRLRTKWVAVHDDEVYFRDTAHGFIVWAVATLATAGFLASAASTATGAGASLLAASSGIAATVPANVPSTTSVAPATPSPESAGAPPTPPPAPVATRVPPVPAQDVERMRSVAAQTALWSFLALIVGAFSASIAATIGGRQRDRMSVALRGA